MKNYRIGSSLIAMVAYSALFGTSWAQSSEDAAARPPVFDGTTASRDDEKSTQAQADNAATNGPEDPSSAEQSATEDAEQARISDILPPSRRAADNRKAISAGKSDIIVTGSRLQGGDATTRTVVITHEDIEKRGVTSVEELIRTLPENVATIGGLVNERTNGPLQNRRAPVSALGSLGVSAANLGGMGAGNTLILVDGRRIAGAAGIEDGFANLNGIPLAAVERVEINTGGSSAVYGADALGGVINFILKKNYIGTTLNGG